MVVWFASGLSLMRWIKPVLMFGMPIVLLTGLLSFVVTPWANRQSAEFRERFEQREDIAKVSPGKFQESSSAERMFFVEGVSGDATKVKNVFVSTVKDGRVSLVVAQEGTTEVDARGDKFLTMSKGRRYDGVPNQSDFQMMLFERYRVLVSSQSRAVVGDKSSQSLSTRDLLADRSKFNMGELLWRISLPLMSLLLLLLAIPLGFVNPRGGRSANLLIALLLVMTYLNLVNVLQAAVVQGRLSLMVAWWPLHLLAALTALALFAWRLGMNSRHHPLAVWRACKRVSLFKESAQ